jgi:16S rRNA (guanine527-N7)-methyltransferase
LNGLLRVLEASQAAGFLGPGPVARHVEHATAYAAAVAPPERVCDLGSGGGVPALPLALTWDLARFTLVDAQLRRVRFLRGAVDELALGDRVEVVHARAEDLARSLEHRAQYDLVTARSFGPPARTAECAVGFLHADGVVLVAEPPAGGADRWPAAGLAPLGLVDDGLVQGTAGAVRRLRCPAGPPAAIPRRAAAIQRNPRF